MTELRKELITAGAETPCMSNGTALLMIITAVRDQKGLIHGRLDDWHGDHCAIGSYFAINKGTSLPCSLIDEVAAVNDSIPNATMRQRKLYMMRWLRWKLALVGMPGYVKAKK